MKTTTKTAQTFPWTVEIQNPYPVNGPWYVQSRHSTRELAEKNASRLMNNRKSPGIKARVVPTT